jgi:hypothetical protein
VAEAKQGTNLLSEKEVQAILKCANEKRKESKDSDEEQDHKLNQIGDFLSMTEAI